MTNTRIDYLHSLRELVPGLVVTAIGFLIVYVIQRICPGWTSEFANLVGAFIIMLLVIALVRSSGRGRIIVLVLLVIGLSTLGVNVNKRCVQRGGTYFVVDLSENMSGRTQGIGTSIDVTSKSVNDRMDIGLIVYGGQLSGTSGCEDITPLVEPAPKETSIPEIEAAVEMLSTAQPSGPETRQRALLLAIDELAERPEVQDIILITSGPDNGCTALNRTALEIRAGARNVAYKLTIVTVGRQTEEVLAKLTPVAHAIVPVDSIEEIPEAVSTIVVGPIGPYYAPVDIP